MFELIIVAVLCKVLWDYGRGIYLVFCYVGMQLDFGLFSALLAALPTAVVLLSLSILNDRQRSQAQRIHKEASGMPAPLP